MKQSSRLIGLLFASVLLFAPPYPKLESCGIWYHPDSYRIAWFRPISMGQPPLAPFHYAHTLLYSEEADPEKLDYRRNCEEWVAYLGNGVRLEDVYRILYETAPEDFLEAARSESLRTTFLGNSFIDRLADKRWRPAREYLELAFRSQFVHFSDQDPWGLNESLLDYTKELEKIVQTAKDRLRQTTVDLFLHQRYAYQIVVNQRYLGEFNDCIQTFDRYLAPSTARASVVTPWGLLHKAFSLEQLGDTLQSSYLLSRVFDLSESKKIRSYRGFDSRTTRQLFKLAQNDREKAVILTLRELHQPGRSLEGLRQIAALAPDLEYLPLLITREINKLEDWILTPQLTFFHTPIERNWEEMPAIPREEIALSNRDQEFFEKNRKKDLAYLSELRSLLETMLERPQGANADFLRLALAHLYQMEQQPQSAQKQLNQISARAGSALLWQKQLEEILLLPQLKNIGEENTRQELAQALSFFAKNQPPSEAQQNTYSKLLLYFSRLFHQKGDIVSAGLLYNRAVSVPVNAYMGSDYYFSIAYFDRYAAVGDIDQLLALAEKPGKSTFENFLLGPMKKEELGFNSPSEMAWLFNQREAVDPSYPMPSREKLLDLKGALAFRQNDLSTALEAWKQLPDEYWDTTYEFKYYLSNNPVATANQWPWEAEQLASSSKRKIAAQLLELQQQAVSSRGKRRAAAHYQLAGAYFNTSWWGNSWMLFSYGHSSQELDYFTRFYPENFTFYPTARKYFSVYYGLERAMEHYQKALDARPEPELAAKITYMLAQCDELRHRAYLLLQEKEPYANEEEETPEYVSSFYSGWQKRYGKTLTYQERIRSCPLLEDHLNKSRE